MPIDLYGHGIRNLPSSGTENYSDGPDRKWGPSKCRGVNTTCHPSGSTTPHDHACCCDPCRHTYIDLCVGGENEGHCCRCVPRAICAIFTPDTTGERCFERSWHSDPATDALTSARSVYSFQIPDNGLLEMSVGANPIFSGGQCTWKLYSGDMYIEEEYAIDHSSTIHCQAPPDFALTGVNIPFYPLIGAPEDCYGTITFEEASLAKIPFIKKWQNVDEFTSSTGCSGCSEVCTILCVKEGNLNETNYTRIEYTYSSGENKWYANDDSNQALTIMQSGTGCYLRLDGFSAPFTSDLIIVNTGECSLGMNLYAVDEVTDDWVKISCNKCSCWDYICGQCRCVCRELCVVGVQDSVLVGPYSLAWDKELMMWSGEGFTIDLEKDDNDNCVVSVLGYADPVSIENTCGDDLSFNAIEDIDDQLASGLVNYVYAFCKRCVGTVCKAGTCLDLCQDVPEILYAEVCPTAWTEMLGCDPDNLCFTCVTFPLIQIFVSTFANPAGEWRWIGSGIISCHDCSPPTSPKNYMVSVDIGCDGNVTFSITDNVGGSCSEQFSFVLPCNYGDVWDFEFETTSACGDTLNGCCDEAAFILRITE